MATQTKPPVDLETLRSADDATFWTLAAMCGYIRPAAIDPDQGWFWTRSWITGEIEADWDEAEGRTTFYASSEEFLASLRARMKHADSQ
ncbi:MAG: hypothetical protein H0W06_10170 [Chloroflexia bacterium]|nr:hypothetical protein [Chloroflexia bacterium]